LKNYVKGKTTNERFAKKAARASFSEAGEGEGTTTYMDGKTESDSQQDGNSSRDSIVVDDENNPRRSRAG
jgi:hypothetical protein